MKNKFLCLLSSAMLLTIIGCSSAQKIESNDSLPPVTSTPAATPIDYEGLQRSLGLGRESSQLGYTEKTFDTCKAGFGFPTTENCKKQFFIVINFQLMCRDSEGTISTALSSADIEPISDKTVTWLLKGVNGASQTDGQGYAQIRTVSSISQKKQRLKLTVGNEFLYMRANEIDRVVAPKPWCN